MARTKKQQTIEATLGRPVLRPRPPRTRASKASDKPAPSGDKVQSWLQKAKPGDSQSSPRFGTTPPSTFMPRHATRKRVRIADDSSSASEASSLEDEEATPKRLTPGKGREKRQTRLALGQLGAGSSPRSAVIVADGHGDDDAESEEDGSESDHLPIATPRRKRGKRQAVADESEDSDDLPIATPKVAGRGTTRRPAPAEDPDGGEDDDEDDDLPPISSMASRRTKRARPEDEDEDEDDDVIVQSTKRRRLIRKSSPVAAPGSDDESSPPAVSSPIKRRTKFRSEKEKRRELLRRRRAGEDITMEDLETSGEEEAHALYDTDSDLAALDEFEDDDEGVLQPEPVSKSKKSKKTKKKGKNKAFRTDESPNPEDTEEGGEDMADFVIDEDEGTLGIPGDALVDIPLEFTRHARKPLREHFRDVIEWLVRFKFEPNFEEKHNELYMIGWRRLDDEVAGLASSKFASAAWKPEFRRVLNARPRFVCVELPRGDLDRLLGTCEACGRSGHPASWTVSFHGAPYYRKDKQAAHFLEDVESDQDSSSSFSESDAEENGAKPARDEDGNELPPESRQWSVGAVCKSNAETAHTLIHWKHDLLEWVEMRLENDGYLTPEQIAARTQMKRKKRNRAVDDIIAKWDEQRTVEELYRDFESVLEEARNKSTTGGRVRGGWR